MRHRHRLFSLRAPILVGASLMAAMAHGAPPTARVLEVGLPWGTAAGGPPALAGAIHEVARELKLSPRAWRLDEDCAPDCFAERPRRRAVAARGISIETTRVEFLTENRASQVYAIADQTDVFLSLISVDDDDDLRWSDFRAAESKINLPTTGVLVGVSAAEGLTPALRLALGQASSLGIRAAVGWVDSPNPEADAARVAAVQEELRYALKMSGYGAHSPVLVGSARGALRKEGDQVERVAQLIEALDDTVPAAHAVATPARDAASFDAVVVLRPERGGPRGSARERARRTTLVCSSGEAAVVLRTADDRSPVEPGYSGTSLIRLSAPLSVHPGLRFALREGGRTIGAGQVVEIVK